ncbi:hypothetical protein RND81_05G121100 [Saponaria officinalis]|uniref:non-specific serine/threonine protein kinase n=1 Tax=Saponaria officinalis TaxID=3572 RepID=A0AAW1KRU5_SAPOF
MESHKMKPITYLISLIIMHLLTATTGIPSVDDSGIKTDLNALLAIKNQLVDNPANRVLSSWNQSVHHCDWDGVICGHRHNRVIELELYSRGLSGTISPFIGNLSFLQEIAMYNNSLHGTIPPEIGRLFRLKRLGLFNNTLVGEIPANLSGCISLEILALAYNKLGGNLPIELRALSNLKSLGIPGNKLTGHLFNVIQNLTSLELISAAYNAFTGTIPDSIGNMKNLNILGLGDNLLTGTIPPSIFNISSLQGLELTNNQLEGSILAPPDMHLQLPQIQILNLNANYLTGPFPIPFLNLTTLDTLALDTNRFTGSVPLDFSQFRYLSYLDLSSMNLKGDIGFISTLANCSNIEVIQLEGNKFTGDLPESVANLSSTLHWLNLGQNQISGKISAGISNYINLAFLFLFDNEFTGTIPNELGNLKKLEQIDFSSNKLTGKIPNFQGNLSRLTRLNLGDNKLIGSIPSNLGSCQNMLYLNFSNNNLNGTLPNTLFGEAAQFLELDLSHNHLTGSLPQDIGNQINIVKIDVSENKFSGEIPNGLGKCSALQYFHIEGNSIHGSIPSSFSVLSSLQTLDLSRNNLSGLVPIYFSKFPMVYLNLSYNDFEGSVPEKGIFANISAISLVGNKGLCGGIQQLHLPRCIEARKRKNKRRLSLTLELTIPIICALIGLLAMATWLYSARRRKKRDLMPSFTEMGEGFLRVSYNMLLKATDEFSSSNLLGAGTFGTVFKGVLDGTTVAIKVLNLKQRGATKSFMAECKALRNTRHRNLVKIITVCSSTDYQRNDFKALVYEFMPKGNLDIWLHEAGNLTLLQRLDIAIHVAHAINYLHHENETPIVHCDLKPSNILLDDDMVAHVGDFGLAKFFTHPGSQNQSSSIGVKGTVGYAAPEYGLGSEASTDGDIYSYGTVLLELMTGRRPSDNMFQEDFNLHTFAEAALPDQVLQIVDPTLEHKDISNEADDRRTIQDMAERRVKCMVSMVSVGVACSNHLPQDRMKITDAVSRLRAARENLLNVGHTSQIYS